MQRTPLLCAEEEIRWLSYDTFQPLALCEATGGNEGRCPAWIQASWSVFGKRCGVRCGDTER